MQHGAAEWRREKKRRTKKKSLGTTVLMHGIFNFGRWACEFWFFARSKLTLQLNYPEQDPCQSAAPRWRHSRRKRRCAERARKRTHRAAGVRNNTNQIELCGCKEANRGFREHGEDFKRRFFVFLCARAENTPLP